MAFAPVPPLLQSWSRLFLVGTHLQASDPTQRHHAVLLILGNYKLLSCDLDQDLILFLLLKNDSTTEQVLFLHYYSFMSVMIPAGGTFPNRPVPSALVCGIQ